MKDLFGHDKGEDSIERLKMFEPPEGYWLAFSGGKDSIVIYKLAERAGVKFDGHYNVTTIDPPELIYFIRENYPNVKWERPERPFLAVLPDRDFPQDKIDGAVRFFKEGGGSNRRVLTGIRSAESTKRAGRKIVEQCYRNATRTYVNPILDWSDNDVWDFIKERKLPYCSLYDEGFKRIGCVMCPMSSRQVREGNRWPRMKEAFRKAFIKLYENRSHLKTPKGRKSKKPKPAFVRWKSGEEMFEWWLHDTKECFNPDQSVLFE